VTAQLDESVPARLAKTLAASGCRVLRFPNAWKGLKNGALLDLLKRQGISCLITCDKNMRYQQSISASGIALIVLPRQRFAELAPLAASIGQAVLAAKSGQTILVSLDGQNASD